MQVGKVSNFLKARPPRKKDTIVVARLLAHIP